MDIELIDWSRAQFALTAMYHWLFVPLTLGLALIMGVMESIYVKTGDVFWRETTKFWMKIFGINFAIGVATGIILEFQFGTNWSNYSWFVGDIFGAPLAIEGIVAFFMEATFIAVMFFGWDRVSKRMHLCSTWLTGLGATLSAWWILVANAWMQDPRGAVFNPDSMRNELVSLQSFLDVAFAPMAVTKFFHSVMSGWVLASLFVVSVCCWYLIKKRHVRFSLQSIKIACVVGLISSFSVAITGDSSAYLVAKYQPMKLAAMEGLYDGGDGVSLVAIGVLNSDKNPNDDKNSLSWSIKLPKMLSFLATRSLDGYVPGIDNIINGGYITKDGEVALSADEMITLGVMARESLIMYREAKRVGADSLQEAARIVLEKNMPYYGYGYIQQVEELVPPVALNFYSFRIMVFCGIYFIAFFLLVLIAFWKQRLQVWRWLLWIGLFTIVLGYVAGEAGWIVSEVGRQPWTIQGLLPVNVAISGVNVSSVRTTFILFAVIFTVLLVAEVGILLREIIKGPEDIDKPLKLM